MRGDTLDIGACGRATERSRAVNGRSILDVGRGLLSDTNFLPTCAEFFADVEARHEMNLIVARAEELDALYADLVEMHEREARRIPIEQRIFE